MYSSIYLIGTIPTCTGVSHGSDFDRSNCMMSHPIAGNGAIQMVDLSRSNFEKVPALLFVILLWLVFTFKLRAAKNGTSKSH